MRLYLGDHLITTRLGFSHHGIYIGCGNVIAKTRDGVRMFTLSEFSKGQDIDVIEHTDRVYSRAQCVERAKSRLGEKNYNLLSSNCEDFANWCVCGKSDSNQVRMAAAAAAGVIAVASAAGIALTNSSAARNAAAALIGGGGVAVAVRAASLVMKAADAARTARDLREVSKKTHGRLETTVACLAVAAGANCDTAVKIAQKTDVAADMATIRTRRIAKKIQNCKDKLKSLI